MKIAHLIDTLISWGGAQTLLLTFAEMAKKFDVETVIVSARTERWENPIADLLRSHGVKVTMFNFKKLYDVRAVPAIARLLKQEQVDVVQTHLSHSNIYGCLAGKLSGIPSVATLHNEKTVAYSRLRIRQSLEHYCLGHCTTRVVAVGQNVAMAYSSIVDSNKIDVIHNAVMPGVFLTDQERLSLRRELIGNPDHSLIVAVGRLSEQKGYFDMLEAFSRVSAQQPKARLVIIGDGRLSKEIKSHANSLDLSMSVLFAGERDDVRRILAASDIFLNTSHWEGLSIAMLEAMAAGLPIVATRVGDAEKLLNNGKGILVNVSDTGAVAEELEYLLTNKDDRLTIGQNAKKFVEKHYLAEAWFEKLLGTYARVKQDKSLVRGTSK